MSLGYSGCWVGEGGGWWWLGGLVEWVKETMSILFCLVRAEFMRERKGLRGVEGWGGGGGETECIVGLYGLHFLSLSFSLCMLLSQK